MLVRNVNNILLYEYLVILIKSEVEREKKRKKGKVGVWYFDSNNNMKFVFFYG